MSDSREAPRFTRRDALRRAGLGLGVVAALPLLQACAPAAAPTSAPAATAKPAAAATTAPAAAATTAPAAAATTAPAAAATTAPAAAATAAPKASGGNVTVSHWFWVDNPAQQQDYLAALKRFNDKDSATQVKWDILPTGIETRQKVLTSYAAGSAPDTSQFAGLWLQELYEGKMIEPAETRFKAWDKAKDFYENVVNMSRVLPNQPMLYVPNRLLVNILYYRQDWFKDAGLKAPDSWDDALAAAQKLTKGDQYGWAMRGGDSNGEEHLRALMRSNGVQIIGSDSKIDIDSPDGIASAQYYIDWFSKYKVTQPSAPTDKFPQMFAAFEGGKIAMLYHGLHSWETQEKALGAKVSACMIPKGKTTRAVITADHGTVTYASSKQKDAAWAISSFLAEPEQAKMFVDWGAAPANKSLASLPAFKEKVYYQVAMESQPYWQAAPSWYKYWPKYFDNWPPNFQRALKGEITAEKFCQNLAKILREG